MTFSLSLDDLLAYTDWQRQKWQEWFRQHGDAALRTSYGPHGDGRLETVGDVIRHIFGAEMRYIDRLTGRPLTEFTSLPNDNVDALFQAGERSRRELRAFVAAAPASSWDAMTEYTILNHSIHATPKKIIMHVVMHEIRHWAQIATVLRLAGEKVDFQDFLFSPVYGAHVAGAK